MAFKFNSGNGGIICDTCEVLYVSICSPTEYDEIHSRTGIDICDKCLNEKKENMILRLIGAMHYGFRIEQSDGHRWIMLHSEEEADYRIPNETLKNAGVKYFIEDTSDERGMEKVYGTYEDCLDLIDEVLLQIDYNPTLENGKRIAGLTGNTLHIGEEVIYNK
jgi:hypothetical protein